MHPDERESFAPSLSRALPEVVRSLAADLERVREEERIRLARAVHDDLGQTLTGLKMDLSWLRRRLSEGCHCDHLPELLEKTAAMITLTDAAIKSVRRIATELRPVILDEFGLVPAIEWQAQEFHQRTNVPCELDLADVPLKGECTTALYRILQEALTNVLRHAAATRVWLSLKADAECVVLEIADNGKGVPDQALRDRQSLGLLGMRERAAIVGGTLEVARRPGNGTRVVARVPRPGRDDPDRPGSPSLLEGQRCSTS